MSSESIDSSWLAALVESSLDALYVVEPLGGATITDFLFLHTNAAGAAQFGRMPAMLIGKTLNEISPPYIGTFRSDLVRAHITGTVFEGTTSTIAPEISARKAAYRIVPFDGLLAVAAIDLTTEQQAETESESLRRLLTADIDSSLTATALLRPIVDSAGTVTDVMFERANDIVSTMFGVNSADIIGKTLYSLVPRRTGGIVALFDECLRTRRVVNREYDARQSDVVGDWIRIQLTPVAEFVIMHAEDVSQQRREEAMLRAIVETAAELITVTDTQGMLRYVNPFTSVVTGLSADQIIGRPMTDFAALHNTDDLRKSFGRLRSGQVKSDRRRIQILDRNGSIRTTIGSTVPLLNPSGEFDGVVTVASDITERIESEEARSELAAALGVAEQQERERIAGDIHDGPVQQLAALSLQLGAASGRSDSEVRALLVRSEEAVIDCIKELRTLMFQLSAPDLEGEGLSNAIRNRAEMLFQDTATIVVVHADLDSEPGQAIKVTLFRLAQEALVNARKHADASLITVNVFERKHESAGPEDRAEIVLEVVDDGRGAEAASYASDIPGHLGISMICDRARQLGGSADISGAPGQGTKVVVTIPVAAGNLEL
jgi:PAS domain S-box-containing protein